MEVLMERTATDNYIKAIAEYRSISVAAESLGISQPAMSSYLKKKEQELGTILFDRSKQPLELTEAGKAYLEYIQSAELLKGEMLQRLADIEGMQTGHMTVGGAVFFNIAYMPRAIAEFKRKYPRVEIEVLDRSVPELTGLALKGEIDAFITPINDDPERFAYEELADEKIYIAVPNSLGINKSLAAKRVSEANPKPPCLNKDEFRKLCENCFIVLKKSQSIGQRMERLFEEYGARPENAVVAEQTMTTLALTNAGVGISLVTESSIRSSGLSDLPALYRVKGDAGSRKVYIAYLKGKYQSRAVAEFINTLKEVNRKND